MKKYIFSLVMLVVFVIGSIVVLGMNSNVLAAFNVCGSGAKYSIINGFPCSPKSKVAGCIIGFEYSQTTGKNCFPLDPKQPTSVNPR